MYKWHRGIGGGWHRGGGPTGWIAPRMRDGGCWFVRGTAVGVWFVRWRVDGDGLHEEGVGAHQTSSGAGDLAMVHYGGQSPATTAMRRWYGDSGSAEERGGCSTLLFFHQKPYQTAYDKTADNITSPDQRDFSVLSVIAG
ncbi:hypothetical protein TIFTF001_007506 [Ficus carica]|uniref:Uncharacterized protein n=1 Tax=Ficus carica TaxID=3494 RepID=A0AA88DGI5_FICCA|nr:hypothetical protein TIFTF001_007506 [Ficus carica]